MISIQNSEIQMEKLLDKMAEGIQLDKSRYDRMISSYESIKKWIEEDELFFSPYKYDVYPHGSVRIRTTVKPIGKDEFDLDIAIHLKDNIHHNPQKIYNELKRRISEHEKYRGMMELKNRCIRLNYAGDYHMDILPGIQENQFDFNRLKVPDRELGFWVSSNPRGYADWFIERANLAKESLLAKAALEEEKLPIDSFKNKKPLQRAVQLLKRYRDIYFQKNDTYKTSSIIITTIAGIYYKGEESIFDTINNIISSIKFDLAHQSKRLKVINPVNKDEDFTDKWDKDIRFYEEFKSFIYHLHNEWQKLKLGSGVVDESIIMKSLFGDQLYTSALVSQSIQISDLRNQNKLGVSRDSGTLSPITKAVAVAVSIKNNTFFGDR
jgi:hypothetical protein